MSWPATTVARKVREHIEQYTSENPISADYPARDRAKLERVAEAIFEKLKPLAAGLDEVLPKKLESEARISKDVRNAAVETTKRLLQLVPGALESQFGEVRKGMEYAWAKEQYGQLRQTFRAVPLLENDLKELLVTFAVANNVTPAQLERFERQVTALLAMVETEKDSLKDLGFGEKLLAIEELSRFMAAGVATPTDQPQPKSSTD